MRTRIAVLFAFLVVGLAMNLNELTKKIEIINTSPLVVLTLVYDSDKNGDMSMMLERVMKNRAGYFEIVSIDCAALEKEAAASFNYCTQQFRAHLPGLTFSSPPLNFRDPETQEKRDSKQVPYQGNLDEKAVFNAILPLMTAYSRNLKSIEDLNSFVKDNAQLPRIIHVTDKESLSPYYKAITAHFRYRIAFAHVFSNSTTLVHKLGVSTFPTLILNEKESLEVKSKILEQLQYLKQYEALEDASIVIPEVKERNVISEEQYKQDVLNKAVYSMVHLAIDRPHPHWRQVQSRFQKMFEYHEGGEQLAEVLGVKKLPAIVYFPKSLVKKQIHRTTFSEQSTVEDIVKEVSAMIEDFSVTIASDLEMQRLTSLSLREKKPAAVLFHSEDPSLSFRVLSNDEIYKDHIAFFRFKNPEEEVMKKFQLKKLPTLMVMYLDDSQPDKAKKVEDGKEEMQLRVAVYNGKYVYNDLKQFFDALVPKSQQDVTSVLIERPVREINTAGQFQKHCEMEPCYLLLVNGLPQNKETTDRSIQTLKSISKTATANLGWVDAACHSETLGVLDIQQEDLPTLIYIKNKGMRYARIVGRVSQDSIKSFVTKVSQGKINQRAITDSLVIEKDCAAEHAKLGSLSNQESTLSPEEKAILEEIRLEEERKREEAQKQLDAAEKARRKQKKKKKRVVESEEDSEL